MIWAIDGPGGTGKSTLAAMLAKAQGLDPERQVIHGDHFFEPAEMGGDVVAGIPAGFNSGRFMREVGSALLSGSDIQVREYNYKEDYFIDRPQPDRRQPIIIEGIKLLQLPIKWDVKVWVDTPREVREERFVQRQSKDRRTAISDPVLIRERFHLWANDAEAYEESIDPHHSSDIIVIDGMAPAHKQFLQLSQFLVVATLEA